ncbi:hypothetical protein [Gordonia humi]|uniref:Diadenosine tetraphosphate (Ap4A) HIT family hydrolase n=1 Tax=Gordonia humi TaxID=686429 RepID=A0A840F520_9ACTN|nr:hypothetical protein [Gordonia humi]MBB4137744.1 diadenosine tetraphosphate (Ap4A) HIT family hydrolase [Gordonia humi]
MSAETTCLMCVQEECAEDMVLFRDDLWAGEIVPGMDVPGWIVLRARRHAELITGLNDAELASLGRRARDLTAAVAEVTGAPATYMMAFGENHKHYHALITARGDDVPADRRRGKILQLAGERVDSRAAAALVPAVAAAYQRYATGPAAEEVG